MTSTSSARFSSGRNFGSGRGRAAMVRPVAKKPGRKACLVNGKAVAYLDSAASANFLNTAGISRRDLDDLQVDTLKVETASDGEMPMESLGTGGFSARIQGSDGIATVKLTKSSVLPAVRDGLLSVGQLTQDGYAMLFSGDTVKIMNATTNEVLLETKRVGNLYPILMDQLQLRRRKKANIEAKSSSESKTTGQANSLTFGNEELTLVNSLDQFDSDSQMNHLKIVKNPSETSEVRPEMKIRNGQKAFDKASLARTRSPPNSNFAQECHERFNHASVAEGSPLYKTLCLEYGDKFRLCAKFTCYSCLMNKTHQLPHPRLSLQERATKNGDGPFAEIFLDTVSYPFAGEQGERYMGLLSNSGRNIACLCSKTKAETPGLVVAKLRQWTSQYGKIDILNCSDFSWVFLPSQNGEVVNNASITKLTYDGAAEFMGKELTSYLDSQGIMHRATCRYTPQQNAAENIVKIVTQGMETLLTQSGLPRQFWCRAAEYFCKIYELLPNSAQRGKFNTPIEALYQKVLPFKKLHHLTRAFGEECVYHEPRELRAHTHGCEKSIKSIFVGFSRRKKGYAILSTLTGKVIDGVWDVFFTGVFPLQVEAIKRAKQHFRALLEKQTNSVYAKHGAPDFYDEQERITEDGEHGEQVATSMHDGTGTVAGLQHEESDFSSATARDSSSTNQRTAEELKQEDETAYHQLLDQITAGDTAVPSNQTFTEDDGICPSSPARLKVGQRVCVGEDECIVRRIYHDGDVALSWPNSSEPDRSWTTDKSQIKAYIPTTSTDMPPLEALNLIETGPNPIANPESNETHDATDVQRRSPRLSYQIGKAMSALEIKKLEPPAHWREIKARSDSTKWITAQREHIEKLKKLKVFEVTTRAAVKKLGKQFRVLNATWAFCEKERAHSGGEMEASGRVAAGGYGQEHLVDYDKTYAPTMAMTAYKANEADAAVDPTIIRECWDISGAYYRSLPDFDQYMKEPPGFETGPDNIWHLLRCMPGTKDAGHCYNVQLTNHLVKVVGFRVNDADHASFRLVHKNGDFINLNIHVDDTAAFSSSQKLMDDVYKLIDARFPMKRRKGIGLMVGIESERDDIGIHLRQVALIKGIVQMAGLQNSKAVTTPCHGLFKGFKPEDITLDPDRRKVYEKFPYRQLVGKIAYVARNTRIDIAWITCELQRYGTNYTDAQIDAVTHLIKYLNGTMMKCLTFRTNFKHEVSLFIAVDAGYGSSLINRASHEGMIAYYKGCAIAHVSKRQKVIALSSMESEFMAATEAAKYSKWLRRLLSGLGMETAKPVPLLEDNQATIYLSKHPSLNGSRSRHMEIRWHWLQQAVQEGHVELVYILTAGQSADILTKPTPKHVHDKLVPSVMGQQTAYTPSVLEVFETMLRDRKRQGKACAVQSESSRQQSMLYLQKLTTPQYAKKEDSSSFQALCSLAARFIKLMFFAIMATIAAITQRLLQGACELVTAYLHVVPQQIKPKKRKRRAPTWRRRPNMPRSNRRMRPPQRSERINMPRHCRSSHAL